MKYILENHSISLNRPTGMHFDLNNDTTTGFWPWSHQGIGSDFYIEAGVSSTSSSYAFMFNKYVATQNDWDWIERDITEYILFGYHVQIGDKVQVEWAIRKSKLTAITTDGDVVMGNKVTIIFNHYYEWEPAGFFLGQGDPAYILDTTKP